MTKHFCPIPFHHMAIRPNGTIQPCCYFEPHEIPKDFTLDYNNLFYDHPFMKQIREDLRQDKPVAGCNKCYRAEELTGKSMRTEYLQEAKLGFYDTPPAEPVLTYIDLALSNVCNNRCRMCSFDLSTNWYSDAKKLGIEIPKGLIEHKNNFDDIDFSKLTYIKMIGGEPLMEQEKFISILNRCKLDTMNILVTTNATVRPNDELLSLLKQCKRVRWNLSIDAFGPLNNVLRKGSKWEEVLENLHWFMNTFPKNVNVNGVVSIYNVNTFYHLTEYVVKNFPVAKVSFNLIDGVDYMHPRHLPDSVKESIIEQLSSKNYQVVPRVIDAIRQQGNFSVFVENDNKMNKLRNETWYEYNEELFNLLKSHLINIHDMSLRQLQLESARVISTMPATNDNIYKFNIESRHNSQAWYIAAIEWYVKKYGGLPSEVGPGKDIKFIYEEIE